MRRFLDNRLTLLFLLVCLCEGVVVAQEAQPAPPAAQSQPSAQQAQPVNPDTAASRELATESEKAVNAAEGHEEYSEFKYSNMVARLGRAIGIDAHGMYWVSLVINFAILALFFWMLLRSRLPQMFRDRTTAIQKALKEAHDASADASRRLADIETRLSKLDAEVADIRATAEREAAAEEERIRASAEEDKHKVVEAAESEIAAIARSARHDLKGFAASLAVDIAAHKIKVDDNTDQALVRQFVDHLGKDGQ
ncbi:MAG TPA: ATP synthase F0 subunit B [Terriglobales bacterium]